MFVPQEIKRVMEALQSNGYLTYLVDDCVRDSLVGSKPKDYDIATSATSEIIPTRIQQGTVTVIVDGKHI
ncbi:hypothetical protein [Brevibacillus laterosporus]|uniref:hypothetical protein n=1 Tax=Brevibacillus laterosporus TaxID=1465 RepID=UPI000E6C6AF0|nr:hypothetical protein [Brevibacillus laterosporus]AYB37593.1 hypothetical protein D5F52_04465 [Brevibacillus laterosporus]MBM7111748.1 Poly(A) polymerase I precursor [Brevibacillus laterosporus]